MSDFTIIGLEMWAYSLRNRENLKFMI